MKKEYSTNPRFVLPLWCPAHAWSGYVEMRKQIKRPLTDYGKKLAINRLAELMEHGHNPTAVLEQSIFHSWQGLFPLGCVRKEDVYGITEEQRQRNLERYRQKHPERFQ